MRATTFSGSGVQRRPALRIAVTPVSANVLHPARRLATVGTAVALVLVLAAGAWMRWDPVRGSLWIDEFGTFWVVQDGLAETLRRSLSFQGQSPLYYVLAWLSLTLFGESELALRVPSLAAGVATIGALALAARHIGGPRAALWAAILGWLSAPAIRASVDARPYALVLLTVALACAGFAWAVRTGARQARALWVLGGAAVAWAHYVQYPVVGGLVAAYLVTPALRRVYAPRQFGVDLGLHGVLVLLCAPQIIALMTRRESLSWLDRADHLASVPPLIALAPILLMRFVARRGKSTDPACDGLARACWLACVGQVAALEVAALVGINLLTPRYFIAIVVPGLLVAAAGLARMRAGEIGAALVGFVTLTAADLVPAKQRLGSFTGHGYDDWRGAVAALTERIGEDDRPVVLYRSGFVEDDTTPLGHPVAATRSPLRSPGAAPFPAAVHPLTFRWLHAGRPAYFASSIAPLMSSSPRVHLLAATFVSSGRPYVGLLLEWVETEWPGRFEVTRTPFGGVELIEFRRRPDR